MKLFAVIAATMVAMASCGPQADRKAEVMEQLELGEIPEDVDVYRFNPDLSEVAWEGRRITGGGHDGTIGIRSGEIYVYDGSLLAGYVEIDMTRIVVLDIEDPDMNARLKGHLESDDFFSVADYPVARLDIASFEALEDAGQDEPNYRVNGNLTIKGITHGMAFDATIDMLEGRITGMADFTFDRSRYDVRFGSGRFFENLGDNLILDDVFMTINILAEMQ